MILKSMIELSAAMVILLLALGVLIWAAAKNWLFPRTRGREITSVYPKVSIRPISIKYEYPKPQPLIRRKNYLLNKTDFDNLLDKIGGYLDVRISGSTRKEPKS